MKTSLVQAAAVIIILFTAISPSNADAFTIYSLPVGSNVKSNPVKLEFNGIQYDENFWLEDILVGKVTAGDAEKTIANVVNINTKGTATDILNTWCIADRDQMSVYINNELLFSASQAWYKSIQYSALLAKVMYGEYTIFIVQHTFTDFEDTFSIYPMVQIDGTYCRTNALSDDPMLSMYIPKIKELISYKIRSSHTESANSE